MNPGQTILDGTLLVAVPIAMLAGLVSFASPCVLPLVPGFLGYVTGLSGVDLAEHRRGRMVLGTLLFVAGFTAVFVALGVATGALGNWLAAYSRVLTQVLGVVTVILGLAYLGLIPMPGGERRLSISPRTGLAGAPLLGAVFGLGWTACTGPTLAAISALSLDSASAARGALLMTAYSLGLGIPFLLFAVGYRRALGTVAVIRQHRQLVTRIGGVMLIVVGLALATGLWTDLMVSLQGKIAGFETPL